MMPDYGSPAVEIERGLEASLAIYPPPDYGTTLLAEGLFPHPPSGGRKLHGGIMMRLGYKGPTVNIRPPKWTDNSFWIRADNYLDAQYIADAVFYYTGRASFHFCDVNCQYPPLRLATRELLTRDECLDYVESIAKGPALLKKREEYKELVKEVVLKVVKSPEALLFLSNLRSVARLRTKFDAAEATEIVDNGIEAASIEVDSHLVGLPSEEAPGNDVGDEFPEEGVPMEVDAMTEQAVQMLGPYSIEMLDSVYGLPYIPSFGVDWFESQGTILRSEGESLGAGWSFPGEKAEEHTIPSNLKDFMINLDEEEEKLWRLTKYSNKVLFRPQPNNSHHILSYNRELLSPD